MSVVSWRYLTSVLSKLSRLRDVSHETEAEQRHRIGELERELAGVEELHCE